MSQPSASLAELFPDADYRFHLTLRRAEPRTFFEPQDRTGQILRERAHWLAAGPQRYLALLPEGEAMVAEFAKMIAAWNAAASAGDRNVAASVSEWDTTTDAGASTRARPPPQTPHTPLATPTEHPLAHARGYRELLRLGHELEPDLLFLSPDRTGQFRLQAGALCFPTGWALEEKIGRPMDVIHGAVPGLNAAIGAPIQQFLSRMKPGVAFLRDNWGIAATDELNLHPARAIEPPKPPVQLERLWLRVEHQALLALPQTRGIVFAIRIALHRLDRIADGPAAAGLSRALATMPAEVAAYKRIDTIRADVSRLL